MMKKWKFALVGCGRIANRHSDLLGNNQIQNAKLVAVCDTNIEKAKNISAKFKVPFYSDYNKMMKIEDIDFVVVLTPSGLHAQNVIDLSKYGKHIIVEKPMALTLEDSDKMINACEKNNIKLFVVKQNRFNVPVVKLKEALENNRFGKLNIGTVRVRWSRDQSYYDQDKWRGTWRNDGGVLANQASHHIDMLQWVMGDAHSVFAVSDTKMVKIEAEDTALAIVKFKNGSLGNIEATTTIRPKDLEGSLSVFGETGSVVIGGFAVNEILTWNFKKTQKEDENIIKNFSVNPPNVYGYGHKAYYDSVVQYMDNKVSNYIDGNEGRKSLKLINALYKSIETKREVYLDDPELSSKLGN